MAAAGVSGAHVEAVDGTHQLASPEEFWTIVLGSGYRATHDALATHEQAAVHHQVVAELTAAQVTEIETNVIYATARKAPSSRLVPAASIESPPDDTELSDVPMNGRLHGSLSLPGRRSQPAGGVGAGHEDGSTRARPRRVPPGDDPAGWPSLRCCSDPGATRRRAPRLRFRIGPSIVRRETR